MLLGDLAVEFRLAAESDLAYVYGAWLSSFYDAHASGPLDEDLYKTAYRAAIRRLIAKPTVTIHVAFVVERPDQIIGFVCADSSWHNLRVVHFLCVKLLYRRQGLGRALMKAAGINPSEPFHFTYKTAVTSRLLKSWKGRFDPLLVRRGQPSKESD